MRLLLVVDSPSLQRSLGEGLRNSGYALDIVDQGRQGLLYAQTSEYDTIILDIMLPEMDGLTVLRTLREKNVATPVLLLTARDTVADRVTGLRAGADDYLIKPFDFDELLARVQALIRRAHGLRRPMLRVGALEIDTSARVATFNGRDVPCAPKEYALLEFLAHRVGRPVTRQELEEHLYDERSQVNSNAVDVAVYGLRNKLEAAGCPPLIQTRRGFGYVLSEPKP